MSNTIDQQFVEFIVKSLVSKPDAVQVERRIDEKGVLLELTVDPEDLGRVIGKRGATAQSLRTLLRALGTKNDARYNLKIIDNGEPRPSYNNESRAENDQSDDNQTAAPSTSDSGADDTGDSDEDSDVTSDEPETQEEETDHSDVVSKTRRELEDLDDLDV